VAIKGTRHGFVESKQHTRKDNGGGEKIARRPHKKSRERQTKNTRFSRSRRKLLGKARSKKKQFRKNREGERNLSTQAATGNLTSSRKKKKNQAHDPD